MTPERILVAVSERFGVKVEALCGQRRTHTIAQPRQVAMYLMRHFTDLSLAEIGRAFGGRDHSTVFYACERVTALMRDDKPLEEKVNGVISTLSSG
jgi:chromosomal replication initiator protein